MYYQKLIANQPIKKIIERINTMAIQIPTTRSVATMRSASVGPASDAGGGVDAAPEYQPSIIRKYARASITTAKEPI